jgi:hypothetical protein
MNPIRPVRRRDNFNAVAETTALIAKPPSFDDYCHWAAAQLGPDCVTIEIHCLSFVFEVGNDKEQNPLSQILPRDVPLQASPLPFGEVLLHRHPVATPTLTGVALAKLVSGVVEANPNLAPVKP